MDTKVVTALGSGDASSASGQILSRLAEGLTEGTASLVMLFASTVQPLGEVAAKITAAHPGAVVLGASTAGEFTEEGDAKSSVAAVAVSGDFLVRAGMGRGLRADPEKAVGQALAGMPLQLDGFPHRTAIILLDPFASNGEEATLLAAAILGEGVKFAGGAAGDDLKMAHTEVSLGAAAETDAVVIAVIFSRSPLGVGVSHAHRALSGPLKVTKASGGTVHELDGRPAWDVWREETSAHAAETGYADLPREREGAFLLTYEAGLSAGSELKIRAPLSRDEHGAISFACGIPEGAVIRITESTPERQIASAREAAKRARHQLGGATPAGAIVFDCICRNLILGDRFSDATRAISDELGGAPLAGFETYGEIALDVGDMSGFHNTTSVVLVFPRS